LRKQPAKLEPRLTLVDQSTLEEAAAASASAKSSASGAPARIPSS
jgi:hypothetical protein